MILQRQSQTMEKEWTKDLNTKDGADLKKKHNCNQCNYSTLRADNLKNHKLIHSGEKPFACSQCKYSCTQASDLKKHLLIHSGENPFKCRQCNYFCNDGGNLKKHLLTHSGEKLSTVHSAATRPLELVTLGHTCSPILEKSTSAAPSASFLVH